LAARQQLGAQAIIGRTCHGSLDLARQAAREGASYVAFGAVYPSSTKPQASRVELLVLCQAKAEFDVPVCVIGGLTVENIDPVVACGVDMYAVVGDVLGLPVEQVSGRVQAWNRV
jgi:thiamine-phosphate pyrophosphorylase